jgi:hypothetical protein
MLFSTIQQSGNTTEDTEAYKPIGRIWMEHEMSELEQANVHMENLNYYTGKKFDTLESQ